MKKTILFLILTLSTLSATARILSVRATLNSANENPANASTGTGTLVGTFDDISGVLNYTLTFSGLSGAVTASHFHNGAAGVNGGVVVNIGAITSPFTGSGTFVAPQISNLLAGNIYVNLHTSANTGGEIRGQLTSIAVFNEATKNNFYGIGGYSHTDGYIPDFSHKSPYIWTGPSPQNDFTYVATTSDGSDLYGDFGELSTLFTGQPITLTFKGNNVRKLGLKVYEVNTAAQYSSGSIVATVLTNLGNTTTLTSTNGARFVGFRVQNPDEYIVSATFSANSGFFTSLDNITFGDDSPQNVALHFDGVDDYVSLPSNVGNFGTDDNFTVTCWFRPDPTATHQQEIVDKWNGSSGSNFAFTIRYNGTAGTVSAGQFTNPDFSVIGSSTDLRDGQWHHIAFTKNGTDLSLYVDGTHINTIPDLATGVTTNILPLNIGRRTDGARYFKGEIDEVRIWNIGKTPTQIADERFCKTPDPSGLQYFYNFNNGVPHDNNTQITQIQNLTTGGSNHGTLNNFARTGDASNFVTGQVKYVKNDATGNNGSSWTSAFTNLQTGLTPNILCNDLFDVYVAKSNAAYKPDASNPAISFYIPTGMRLYGGFAGTEKSINQRNMALIQTTNQTTLSGDLLGNDTPFNFTTNHTDNSFDVVQITGSNASLDGFTIRGAGTGNGVSINSGSTNTLIKHNKVIDNRFGIIVQGNNSTIANSIISGNQVDGVNAFANALTINNSLIANNGRHGVYIEVFYLTKQTNISNSTIASNAEYGIAVFSNGTSNNTLKNTLIFGNGFGGIFNDDDGGNGTITNTITYSLVQGVTTGTGNLNGTTVNPQFVSPLGSGFGSLSLANMGDYRLKWCSLAIGAGNNTGISPLDLDRNPRNFNGTTDMGAYEFLGNKPSQVNVSNITGTIDSPTYAGGAIQTITSTAKVIAPAGAIDFKAPNAIILNPGFEARGVGKYFKAEIGANQSCSN